MVDALCLYDLDPYGRELNDPLQELWQDLLHRLLEAPGSNLDDPDRGVGLEDMLSQGFDASQGAPSQFVAQRIRADFLKDDRVLDCQAALNWDGANVTGTIQIVANEGTLGVSIAYAGGVLQVTNTGGT